MRAKRLTRVLLSSSQPVFFFHRVGHHQAELYPEGLSTKTFSDSLKHLLDLGYRFTSLREAQADSHTPGYPRAVLAADDGFSCIYHEVLPIIRKHQIPLTVFMIGCCIDNRALAWNHKLIQIRHHADESDLSDALSSLQTMYSLPADGSISHRMFSVPDHHKDEFCDELWDRFCPTSQEEYLARKKPFLSLTQMQELQNYGVEFALHSHSHADVSRLSYPQICDELHKNKEALSDAGFEPLPFFAFPYGRECSPGLLSDLCKDTSLKACLGIRYRSFDNHPKSRLWQRVSLEHCPFPSLKELWLVPRLRRLKDALSLF